MSSLTLHHFTTVNLHTIALQVASGECVALWGASGSGKSRLLRAIADLDPHHGEAWCGELQRSQLPAPAWRQRVGYLPAESHWWSPRVGDHFPATCDLDLTRLGLEQAALDWEIARISSGERQRLALLRMLAQRPEVLLLDEATANLDQENSARVEALIADYRSQQQAAVLWVSHDPQQRRRIAQRGLEIVANGLQEVTWS